MLTASEFELRSTLEHLNSIRECVTNFTGYVLGGSGILLVVLGAATSDKTLTMGIVSILGSVVVSLVTVVLMYKFNSHNRMSGYIKVIEHEHQTSKSVEARYIWEICIGRLQHYSTREGDHKDLSGSLRRLCDLPSITSISNDNLYIIIQYVLRKESPIDLDRTKSGLMILALALIAQIRTQSWVYPAYIAAIMFVIVAFMLTAGGYLIYQSFQINSLEIGFFITVLAAQSVVWLMFVRKLHDLLEGSSSVDAYFWRFLAIRAKVLTELGVDVQYPIVDHWLQKSAEKAIDQVERAKRERPYKNWATIDVN